MFTVTNPLRRHTGRRLAAIAVGALLATAAGLTPHAVTPAQADSRIDACGTDTLHSLNCAEIRTPSVGNRNLDLYPPAGAGGLLVAYWVHAAAPLWKISPDHSDGTFTLYNRGYGKCLTADGSHDLAGARDCTGAKAQKWYVTPSGNVKNGVFLIRNEATGKCLDITGKHQDGGTVRPVHCTGAPTQQWIIGADNPRLPEADQGSSQLLQLAIEHASIKCAKDTKSCSWSQGSMSKVYYTPKGCFGAPVGNHSSVQQRMQLAVETSKSATYSIANSVEVAAETGGLTGALIGKITVKLTTTYTATWSHSTTWTKTYWHDVPPGKWGWIWLQIPMRKVTGEWTFDANSSLAWTVPATVGLMVQGADPVMDYDGGAEPPKSCLQGSLLPQS
ncbi:RICIN domain-containing protein [Streptomyces sp. MS06]|uniref:RICIN domain-containing protein n=1 Tax=Streptomyces sp. MS06 TaxID=3385974 RepID=UPI0039A263D8